MLECKVLLDTVDKIADFVKVVNKFDCDVDLKHGRYIVDGKSLMGLYTLSLDKMVEVVIHSDDDSLLDKLKEFRA